MFSNKKEVGASSSASGKNTAPSLLSSDLVVHGNLESDGDLQIDGTVEGDIKTQKLTVSGTAIVRGSIEAEVVTVSGQVTGQIKARHVTLSKSARVIADVTQERLHIEPGAYFEGNCRHLPGEEEKGHRRIEQNPPAKTNGSGASGARTKGQQANAAAG